MFLAIAGFVSNPTPLDSQPIILGCTEISLLVNQRDATVPLFDATCLHAREAAEWSLTDDAVASAR